MGTERPTFPGIYLSLARALAQRSTCSVDPVGAVITTIDFRKVLAIGYRGNASGLPNGCDVPNHEGGACGCLHAEENAVIACDAPRSEPKVVFSSSMPCRACAKRLVNLGGVQDLYAPDGPGSVDVLELIAGVGIRVHFV